MSHTGQQGKPDNYHAFGIARGGVLIGSVVYSRYRPPDMEIHIHTTNKHWCNRRILRHIFYFPFMHMKCRRVSIETDPANPAVVKFMERIGFVHEGVKRKSSDKETDMIQMGMLREECKWVE